MRLEEYEFVELPLSEVLNEKGEVWLYPEVTRNQFASLALRAGRLGLQAGSRIGQMKVADNLVLVVEPRVPVRRLNYLLEVTGHSLIGIPEQPRRYEEEEEGFGSFVDEICRRFVSAAQPLLVLGLHHDDEWASQESSFPVGRIDFAKSVARFISSNRPHRVLSGRFLPQVDTAPNRAVKYAVQYLGWHYQAMQGIARARGFLRELDRIWGILEAVGFDHRQDFLRERVVLAPSLLERRFGYYVPLLALAKLVAELSGVEIRSSGGAVQLAALLLEMESVFEDYVREVLESGIMSARVLNGNLSPPHGGQRPLFDDSGSRVASPDAVLVNAAGEVLAVLDVKYKPYSRGPDRGDINQLVTYAATYRAPVAFLVSPAGSTSEAVCGSLGRIGATRFFWHCFDLLAESEVEESRLCDAVRGATAVR